MVGTTVGHYRILEKLGEGAMGVVFRAQDTRLGREVALKALPPEFARDPTRRQRFEREARAAALLNHPGIAAVYSLEPVGDELYIVFEYVHGESLRAALEKSRPDLAAILDMATQIADALSSAHAAGIVHRDLKPENILRTPEGRMKILDFGLARFSEAREEKTASMHLTSPGIIVGTVSYMSPEQLEGIEPDFRSDIFSFGVLLYELACGARPFDGATTTATMSHILTAEPVPPAQRNPRVPAELDRIIRKCLRKKREERYQSTKDLQVDLQNLLRDLQAAPAPVSAPVPRPESSDFIEQPSMFATHNPRRWWEAHQLLEITLAAVLIYLGWLARPRVQEPWIFPALLVLCVVQISYRLFLLAIAVFNPIELPAKGSREHLWIGADGLGIVAILAYLGVELFEKSAGLAAIFIGSAVAGIVDIFFIEPAIAHGAFPSSAALRAAAVPETEADSTMLRRALLRLGLTPRRWWELNHLLSLVMIPIVLYVVWLAKEARKDALGLALYYTSLALCAVLASLRLYQLCLSMFIPQELSREVTRVEPWQRRGDLLFMCVLLVAAASAATLRVSVAAFLGVIGLGGIVVRLLVEPAISRAAFPSSAEIPAVSSTAPAPGTTGARFGIAAIQLFYTAPLFYFALREGSDIGDQIQLAASRGQNRELYATLGGALLLIALVFLGVIASVAIVVREQVAARWYVRGFMVFLLADLICTLALFVLITKHSNLMVALLCLPVLVWLPFYQRQLAKRILEAAVESKH